MLGACIGDIIGSVYEFNAWKSREFPLFSEKSEFTDSTVCTIAVAECLLDGSDLAAALCKWCHRYPALGYGGSFAAWLAGSLDEALALARHVTAVTHNHPEGIKGAEATVTAIWLARQGKSPEAIRSRIHRDFGYDLSGNVDEIRPHYRFNETCQDTVPQAIVCALEAVSFEDAVRKAVSLGGDADTLAAIAGPIAEVRFGIPEEIRRKGWLRLPKDMRDVLERLYENPGAVRSRLTP